MTWFVRVLSALLVGLALAIGLPDPAPAVPAPAAVDWPAGATGPGAHVLEYDPRGDGRIVEAYGDLATAARIAILIPGADTTLANFHTGLGGVQRRAPAWQARQLLAASGPGTAVVAWLGYDAPEGFGRAVLRSERARAGADALLRFVYRLTGQCPHATLALIGHSYGSVVLGQAASRLPGQVTDLVAIGSPGMDVARAADLDTTARVWAGSGPADWTRRLPDLRLFGAGHGTNPALPRFGARALDVHDAPGHDGYFGSGTAALASLAAVVRAPVVAP
jgi:pimeloyl-ACP methyl ester carboxylesterase